MTSKALWIAYLTIARKETWRIFRIWKQTLLPPVITQSLYFIIFGSFIGSRVGELNGIPYMAFLVPGLVMMAVIQGSFSNVVSSFYISKFQRNIEEILVSPTPNWVVLAGFVTGGVVRGIATGLVVFLVSLFFVHPDITHVWAIALFAILTSVVFSLGGFLNAIYAKSFDDIGIFTTFVLTPLTYLGGVFYAVESLPEPWRQISAFNPIVYMVDGFRYGFFGQNAYHLWIGIVMLMACIAVLAGYNLHLLKKGTGLKQ